MRLADPNYIMPRESYLVLHDTRLCCEKPKIRICFVIKSILFATNTKCGNKHFSDRMTDNKMIFS